MIYRIAHPPSYGQTELIHVLRRCGLVSGLKLCLDAGDKVSYSGSGQSWLDTSGNGYDFFRGATGSAAGDDPTFNGTAGRRSAGEYWSFDGGDFFRYDAANETWMNNLHKNNALFTAAFWVYVVDSVVGVEASLFGTLDYAAVPGVKLYWYNPYLVFVVYTTGGAVYQALATKPGSGSWHFIALSVNEAGDSLSFVIDQTSTTMGCTYINPSTSAAGFTLEIGCAGGGHTSTLLPNGSALSQVAMWEGRALTVPELLMLQLKTRGRFGY